MMTDKIEIFEDEGEEFHLFEELVRGDIFKDGRGDYHMCVGITCDLRGQDYWANTINLETGGFSYFPNGARVYPFKKVKITVYK